MGCALFLYIELICLAQFFCFVAGWFLLLAYLLGSLLFSWLGFVLASSAKSIPWNLKPPRNKHATNMQQTCISIVSNLCISDWFFVRNVTSSMGGSGSGRKGIGASKQPNNSPHILLQPRQWHPQNTNPTWKIHCPRFSPRQFFCLHGEVFWISDSRKYDLTTVVVVVLNRGIHLCLYVNLDRGMGKSRWDFLYWTECGWLW